MNPFAIPFQPLKRMLNPCAKEFYPAVHSNLQENRGRRFPFSNPNNAFSFKICMNPEYQMHLRNLYNIDT